MTSPLRLVFAGSPAVATICLDALLDSQHTVASVITRNDSRQGRHRVVASTPVASMAEARGIQVIRSNRLGEEVTEEVRRHEPDLGVIVAYGGLVREPLLTTPRLGWINVHFSLLPRWRGAAPVQRAIMAGDELTGATVFQLVPELDAGAILGTVTRPIGALETAGHLLDSLAHTGAALLVSVIDALAAGTSRATPQEGTPTFAPKLAVADGDIDWSDTPEHVHAQIRGVTPEPGAFTTVDHGRLKILSATIARDIPSVAAGDVASIGSRVVVGTPGDPIELLEVHPAGKRAMDAASWWRGRAADAGASTARSLPVNGGNS